MPLGHIHPNLLFEVTFRHFLTLRFSYNLVIFGIFLPISPKVQENKGLQNHHEFFKNPVRFLILKTHQCTLLGDFILIKNYIIRRRNFWTSELLSFCTIFLKFSLHQSICKIPMQYVILILMEIFCMKRIL